VNERKWRKRDAVKDWQRERDEKIKVVLTDD